MSTHREHRMPPMTMSQYITAGFLLIFLEIIFVVLSNEADIITEETNLAWYNPFALMNFANKQMEINNKAIEIRYIDLRTPDKDTFEQELVHLFVIDQTTPQLRETDMEGNYEAFMSPAALLSQFDAYRHCDQSTRQKIGKMTLQNIIAFYMLSRCMRDAGNFRYFIYDYRGIKDTTSLSCLKPRKIKDSQKIMHEYNGNMEQLDAIDDFLREDFNFKVNNKARSDFQEIFEEIRICYDKDILPNLKSKDCKIILNVVSDFVHEEEFPHKVKIPLVAVKDANDRLMQTCNRIAAVNLIILPFRKQDNDKSVIRDNVVECISSGCYLNSKQIKFIDNESSFNSALLHIALNNLPTKVPIHNSDSLLVYQPFNTGVFDKSAFCKFSFNLSKDAGLVTMQLKKNSTNGLPNLSLRVLDEREELFGEIPEQPRMLEFNVINNKIYTGQFLHPSSANSFSDLSLVVTSKDYTIPQIIPLKFSEKMTRMETEILGYVTAFSVVLAFFWVWLLVTGKAFYNRPGGNPDEVDKFFQRLGQLMHKYLPWFVAIVLFVFCAGSYLLMRYILSAFSGEVLFSSLILFYVSFTFYFHLRHIYIYTNPGGG